MSVSQRPKEGGERFWGAVRNLEDFRPWPWILATIFCLSYVPGTASALSADAYWTGLQCDTQSCFAIPNGDHGADLGEAPADGVLEVDRLTEDTCSIGSLGGTCSTQGETKSNNECHTAVATTDAENGGIEDDTSTYPSTCSP